MSTSDDMLTFAETFLSFDCQIGFGSGPCDSPWDQCGPDENSISIHLCVSPHFYFEVAISTVRSSPFRVVLSASRAPIATVASRKRNALSSSTA